MKINEKLLQAWELVKQKRYAYEFYPEPTTKRAKKKYFSSRYARIPQAMEHSSESQSKKAIEAFKAYFKMSAEEQNEMNYQLHEQMLKIFAPEVGASKSLRLEYAFD